MGEEPGREHQVRHDTGSVPPAHAATVMAGVLGDRIGIIPVLAVQGVGYVVAGLLMFVLLDPSADRAPASATLDLPGTRS